MSDVDIFTVYERVCKLPVEERLDEYERLLCEQIDQFEDIWNLNNPTDIMNQVCSIRQHYWLYLPYLQFENDERIKLRKAPLLDSLKQTNRHVFQLCRKAIILYGDDDDQDHLEGLFFKRGRDRLSRSPSPIKEEIERLPEETIQEYTLRIVLHKSPSQ